MQIFKHFFLKILIIVYKILKIGNKLLQTNSLTIFARGLIRTCLAFVPKDRIKSISNQAYAVIYELAVHNCEYIYVRYVNLLGREALACVSLHPLTLFVHYYARRVVIASRRKMNKGSKYRHLDQLLNRSMEIIIQ